MKNELETYTCMSLRCILVSSLIGFTIISLGLLIGYFLDPRPLSVYEDMALFAFLIKQWYIIPCAVCFGFLFCGLIGFFLEKLMGMDFIGETLERKNYEVGFTIYYRL